MRTDSVRVAAEALAAVRELIAEQLRRRRPCPRSRTSSRTAPRRRTPTRRSGRPTRPHPGGDGALPRRRRAQALHPDLAALRRLADDAGAVRRHRRAGRGGPLRLQGPRRGRGRRRVPARLPRGGGSPVDKPPAGAGGRGAHLEAAAGAREGRGAAPRGAHGDPEVHPAAAALHRVDAGQGARGERHRPPLDVRTDHRHALRPLATSTARRGRSSPPSSASWSTGCSPPRSATSSTSRTPPAWRSELDEIAEGKLDWRAALAKFWAVVHRRPRARQGRDDLGEGPGCRDQGDVPDVRRADGAALRPLRRVPRLLELPDLQDDPRAGRTAAVAEEAPGLPRVRRRDGAQALALRPVLGVLALPGVQGHAQARHRHDEPEHPLRRHVPVVRRGRARREALAARPRVLGVQPLPEVHVHAAGQAGAAPLPVVRRAVRAREEDGARRGVRARGCDCARGEGCEAGSREPASRRRASAPPSKAREPHDAGDRGRGRPRRVRGGLAARLRRRSGAARRDAARTVDARRTAPATSRSWCAPTRCAPTTRRTRSGCSSARWRRWAR